jgi:SAM-dependent methyltransferase
MDIQGLVAKVKEKRELSGISDNIVLGHIRRHIIDDFAVSSMPEKDIKELVSSVRAELRRISGSFQSSDAENISVRERSDIYPLLSSLFSSLRIKSVLDLGCGLNPRHLAKSGMKYHAYDINEASLKEVKQYFDGNNIEGAVKVYDLIADNDEFPHVDITLFMKVFDVLEKSGHKLAEKLITRANSKYLLVSFPTKTLSGAPMRHPQRGWIEHLLKRLGFSFVFFSAKNEIFYLASRLSLSGLSLP